jgi:exo-beta-1,3-glucanase (GH17 family)
MPSQAFKRGCSAMSQQISKFASASSVQFRLWLYCAMNITLVIVLGIWFWHQNQPVELANPALPADGKLQCVSYAPYYGENQSPYIPDYKVSKAQIDSDFELLAKRFQCVRTYSVGQGLDYVPEAAAKLGLKVLLGAWIGWGDADNRKELALAIKRANQYPDTVTGLVVGNEVLLRTEQPFSQLRAYIEQANAQTEVPVTYAEVWEYWLRNKELASSVDFVTVHILPYWEDDPQPIDRAVAHAENVMQKVDEAFDKPIFIGETGWPSVGRQRGESEPSQLNQARYLREFVQLAQSKGWNYNLIEAIDQPWKRLLEGTVGGSWGLYSSDLQAKFDFNGPMAERQDGYSPWYWAIGGLLIWLAASLYNREKRPAALLAMAGLGAVAGMAGLLQIDYLNHAARTPFEWLGLAAVIAAGWLALLCFPRLIAVGTAQRTGQLLQASIFVLLLGTVVASWYLIVDWRYRDFALVLYALPAIQLLLGLYLAGIATRPRAQIYYLLNAIAVLTAVISVIIEPNNLDIWLWAGLVLLLACASWPQRKPVLAS